MAVAVEFLSPTDKPALLGLSTPEYLAAAQAALGQMDYKVHVATSHENFLERFGQVQYQVVILEDTFGGVTADENVALQTLQTMSMALRRHATVILIGAEYESLKPLQAFQKSVHAVINQNDLGQLQQILMQVINETALFLNAYRDVQSRMVQGRK